MRNPFQYALATIGMLLVLSAASQAQSNPPLFNATQSYKIGDLVTYDGVTFQCLINETTTHPNPHQPPYWGVNYVYSGALIMPVGPSEPLKTITAAWAYIAGARIANNSYIELKLDPTYNELFSSSFSLDHPYGSKILIVGTNAGQEAIFHGTGGFTLDSGHTLADLEGLKIFGQTGNSNGLPAIQVTQNACLAKLQNMTIENFDIGLEAASSATIDNVATITLTQFKTGGAEALNNATITFSSPVTFDGANSAAEPSYGFSAQGGTINCNGCTANNCSTDFYSVHAGKIEANYSSATNKGTTETGYYAADHGFIYAGSSTATGGGDCYVASQASFIDAGIATAQGYSFFGYDAGTGATIDASGNQGGTATFGGSTDGSYVYGVG